MSNFDNWIGSQSGGGIAIRSRAIQMWKMIEDRPTSIVLRRKNVDLAAQTVRIEDDDIALEQSIEHRTVGFLRQVIFGVKNHPTIADTDLLRGDRFTIDNVSYEITVVIIRDWQIQAVAESRSS